MTNASLNNVKVLITAGPTREAIDPVRFISNYSSGKMGCAIAEAFLEKIKPVVINTDHFITIKITGNLEGKLSIPMCRLSILNPLKTLHLCIVNYIRTYKSSGLLLACTK